MVPACYDCTRFGCTDLMDLQLLQPPVIAALCACPPIIYRGAVSCVRNIPRTLGASIKGVVNIAQLTELIGQMCVHVLRCPSHCSHMTTLLYRRNAFARARACALPVAMRRVRSALATLARRPAADSYAKCMFGHACEGNICTIVLAGRCKHF